MQLVASVLLILISATAESQSQENQTSKVFIYVRAEGGDDGTRKYGIHPIRQIRKNNVVNALERDNSNNAFHSSRLNASDQLTTSATATKRAAARPSMKRTIPSAFDLQRFLVDQPLSAIDQDSETTSAYGGFTDTTDSYEFTSSWQSTDSTNAGNENSTVFQMTGGTGFKYESCPGEDETLALCGYPMFYRKSDCESMYCDGSPMKYCENEEGMISFAFLLILLGMMITASNLLLPYAVARCREMRSNPNYIKVSLSFADLLCGIVILTSILPNLLSFRSTSERRFAESAAKDNVSSFDMVTGALSALSLEASLLHLLLLSVERYFTIRWAVNGCVFQRRTILISIVTVWCASVIFAILPIFWPAGYSYQMLPVLFLSFPTAKPNDDGTVSKGLIISACVAMLLPYTIMVAVCFLTWSMVRRRRMKTREWRSEVGKFQMKSKGVVNGFLMFVQAINYPSWEMTAFKSLLIMVAAFSVTLLPMPIVALQYSAGYYTCDNYVVPYTLAFYASFSNSFVNPLIYAFRDRQFRNAIFPSICRKSDSTRGSRKHRKPLSGV